MDLTVRHLLGIDQALGVGAVVKYKKKDWEFTPLTFMDLAKLVSHNKSEALQAYLEQPAQSPMVRMRDMNGLLCRGMVEEDLDWSNPSTTARRCFLSLLHEHPDLTEEELDKMLSDDVFRNEIADVMHVVDNGPLPQQEAGKSAVNPPAEASP